MGMAAVYCLQLFLLLCVWIPSSAAYRRNSTECPVGWIHAHTEGCFAFLAEVNLTWFEAMVACEKEGGYLAEPNTPAQMEFLTGLAWLEEELYGIKSWWIGLSDVGHESVWT